MKSPSSAFPLVTIINGSLGGAHGNTALFMDRLANALAPRARVRRLDLADGFVLRRDLESIRESAGFVFASGTYWDSWGSPLQHFWESMTPYEGDACWFGKPAACLTTMHSVGGKEVLSRLQGVLVSLGLWLPPMSGLTLGLATQLAARVDSSHAADLWEPADLDVVAHNLLEAVYGTQAWRAWPVDRADPTRLWARL
jgi:multimeric flavodoxin WrbA